jgi:hypothetical protein
MATQIEEKVSSAFLERFPTNFKEQIETEVMRKKIIAIFWEETKDVDFAEIVKKYAGEEMDKRVFRSVKYWAIVVISALITSGIGIVAGLLIR